MDQVEKVIGEIQQHMKWWAVDVRDKAAIKLIIAAALHQAAADAARAERERIISNFSRQNCHRCQNTDRYEEAAFFNSFDAPLAWNHRDKHTGKLVGCDAHKIHQAAAIRAESDAGDGEKGKG